MPHPDQPIVTGAFSYTGRCVARRLLDQGIGVRTLTWNPQREGSFGDAVPTYSLDFSDPEGLCWSMEGAGDLYNTYWIRFGRRRSTFEQAVEHSKVLFDAAADTGVGRIVHFSVANASPDPGYPTSGARGRWRRI